MNKRSLVLLILAMVITTAPGCSIADLFGQKPASTPTPTKTFVPTFTATPTIVADPTDTPAPTSTPTPTMLPETPTPTLGPPTNTPTPRPPAPTPTPKPPAPTNTPQPAYEFHYVSGPIKDPCYAGTCLPEIRGIVIDAQGNPLHNFNRVWIKLDSAVFGVEYCPTGDEAKMLQPGQFKFESPDGRMFKAYTLTVVRNPGGAALSAPRRDKMNAMTRGQQTNIVFQRNQ